MTRNDTGLNAPRFLTATNLQSALIQDTNFVLMNGDYSLFYLNNVISLTVDAMTVTGTSFQAGNIFKILTQLGTANISDLNLMNQVGTFMAGV